MIGFDCEAIQKRASVFIGVPAATSEKPTASRLRHLVLVGDERDGAGQRVAFDERLERGGDLVGRRRAARARGRERPRTRPGR